MVSSFAQLTMRLLCAMVLTRLIGYEGISADQTDSNCTYEYAAGRDIRMGGYTTWDDWTCRDCYVDILSCKK